MNNFLGKVFDELVDNFQEKIFFRRNEEIDFKNTDDENDTWLGTFNEDQQKKK